MHGYNFTVAHTLCSFPWVRGLFPVWVHVLAMQDASSRFSYKPDAARARSAPSRDRFGRETHMAMRWSPVYDSFGPLFRLSTLYSTHARRSAFPNTPRTNCQIESRVVNLFRLLRLLVEQMLFATLCGHNAYESWLSEPTISRLPINQ